MFCMVPQPTSVSNVVSTSPVCRQLIAIHPLYCASSKSSPRWTLAMTASGTHRPAKTTQWVLAHARKHESQL